MDDYESVLFIANECFVYKIPPRTSNRGYKASEWGETLDSFIWKGRLRVIEKGEKCYIRMEDANTGDLFAVCPYDGSTASVEPVLDSSRYFVLRVEDSGRKAYIGMGFQERSEAFDFNIVLQDHIKHVKAEKEAQVSSSSIDPPKDWSLKGTISINIGGSGNKDGVSRKPKQSSSTNVAIPLLAPPPSAASVRKQQSSTSTSEFNWI